MRRRAVALFFVLLTLFACLAPQAYAAPSDWDENNPGALLPTHLYAQTAVLIDAETGDVLFDKDSLVRMYPASTTKIMTLLLAVESDIPLEQEITIPDVAENVPSDSSKAVSYTHLPYRTGQTPLAQSAPPMSSSVSSCSYLEISEGLKGRIFWRRASYSSSVMAS